VSDAVYVLLRYAFHLCPGAATSCVVLRLLGAGLSVLTPLLLGAVVGRVPAVATNGLEAEFIVLLALLLATLRQGIELRNVSFAYPREDPTETTRLALKDIDLVLPAGSTVAFAGSNGAGKSTLVKLLARLYDPTEGAVLVDGVPLTELDSTAWRARLSAGFQDYATFEFLAVDSVGVGDLHHRTDRTRVQSAVVHGQAREVIESLPAGMDTQLGTSFDGGVGLSGGQWQQLALARSCASSRC